MAQIPIPDFTQAGVHFGEASREIEEQFERINNIPTVQLQEIANQLTNITQAIQRLNESVNRLENKMNYNNTNTMIRLQNSYATSSHDTLVSLLNPVTGIVIPNIPADSNALQRLTGPQIRDILHELGQAIPNNQGGGIALLRKQLRIQMGLRAEQAPGA